MREFTIRLSSVQDVQAFVDLSTTQPFPVYVRDGRRQASAKRFMEMFSLDVTHPLTASADCSQEQLEAFRSQLQPFLADK